MHSLLRPGTFVLAVFCFVLPFVELRCSGKKIAQLTGYELIFPKDDQAAAYADGTLLEELEEPQIDNAPQTEETRVERGLYGLVAGLVLLASIVAVALNLLGRKLILYELLFGLSAFLLLAYEGYLLEYYSVDDYGPPSIAALPFELHLLYGYWLCLIALGGGVTLCILSLNNKEDEAEEEDYESTFEIP